jgi:hypothetical protein
MGEKTNPFGGEGGCYFINENLERVKVGAVEAPVAEIAIEESNDDDASN